MRKVALVIIILLSLALILGRTGVLRVFQKEEIKKISFQEAPENVGEKKWVHGKVDHVFVSPEGDVFINFCEDYRDCPFYSVIFSGDTYLFEELEDLKEEKVAIKGEISLHEGRPQIVVEHPEQIKVLDNI